MGGNIEAAQAIEAIPRYIMKILADADEPGVYPESDSYQAQEISIGESYVWLLGRDPNSNPSLTQVYNLIDECSRLNLNTATQEMLEALPGMTTEFAAAIIDWRDEDDEVSTDGAEVDSYLTGSYPYRCKNAPFESIFELHWVYGAVIEDLYGEDTNLNGLLDVAENDGSATYPNDNQNGILDPGILEYVTIYSREPNKQSDGSDRINLNDEDSSEDLTELLEEKLGEDRASEIGGSSGNQEEYDSLLDYFSQSGMTVEEFAKIEDALTVSDEDYLEGLINVNTACAQVLACIPGIDEDQAQSLVAYRQSHSGNENTIAWVTEVLEEDNWQEAGPYLTSRTYQYSLDVAAVGRNGKGYRRTLFVIDVSEDEPAIRYRRDLSALGWALDPTIRQNLALLKEPYK